MTDREKIEESHGIWELEAIRLSAMCEAKAAPKLITQALVRERQAFFSWVEISNRAVEKP